MPSRICPRARRARGAGRNLAASISTIAQIIAANVRVLIMKTHPVPTAATSTPATAGPINRAELNDVEFRATALDTWVSGTISETNVCRTGASNVATIPRPSANAYTVGNCATSRSNRMPNPRASSAMTPCVITRIRRRS